MIEKRYMDSVADQPVEVIRGNVGTPGETLTFVFSSHQFKQNSRVTFLASELYDVRRILSEVVIARYSEAKDIVKCNS